MLRITTLALAVLVSALSLAATAGAGRATLPKLVGTVGPGFTITLKRFNKPLKTLKAGTYSITVSDKSPIHNFHLKGPGVNKIITAIGFKGFKTVVVKLSKGTYTFVCDPHFTTMKGSFKVT
jgi:plastocyanin